MEILAAIAAGLYIVEIVGRVTRTLQLRLGSRKRRH